MIGPAELYSFRALWRQYRACRRGKRTTHNALRFESDAEAHLLALRDELLAHTYRPGPSICFVTAGPKPREVFAAASFLSSSRMSADLWENVARPAER